MLENKIQALIEALNENTQAILSLTGQATTKGTALLNPPLKLVEEPKEVVKEEVKITLAELRAIASKLLDFGKKSEVVKLLADYKLERLSDAKPELYNELSNKLNKLVSEHEQALKN